MRSLRYILSLLALVVLLPRLGTAQNYINQSELAELLTSCPPDPAGLPEITYDYFQLYSTSGNSVIARNTFYNIIGDGNPELGRRRSKLVGLLNRLLVSFSQVGDTLIVPSRFDLNFCAYSPFPHLYEGGREFDKLFIIDKEMQAYGAYEHGILKRWGIVSTGADVSPTPSGRFNFNWKTEYRVSTLSPPGEPWEMYWVYNFHEGRGIHIHQYAMPTGGPQSHGCVRLVEEDAQFIYNWAEGWKVAGNRGPGNPSGRILEQGTTVLVLNENPTEGQPQPFLRGQHYPVLRKVVLPAHPYDVPPGTEQQRQFDRVRGVSR